MEQMKLGGKEALFWAILLLGILALLFFAVVRSVCFPLHLHLFPNSNFENGDLTNWVAEGEAFVAQPTYGDNTWHRISQASNVQGSYWIGTFEKRRQKGDLRGSAQGDAPSGTLASVLFTLERDAICFLIGGGNGGASESVALEVEGKRVLTETPGGIRTESEGMVRVIWDVSRWRGKKARIIIEDKSGGRWGHINADDFRYAQ